MLAIVVRTWKILNSIFTIFCFITKKERKQGKSCVEFMAEMSSKNTSVRTGSPDSVIVIFQSKTLTAPGLPRLTMKALVQANKHSTVRELATALKVSVGSVHGYLKSLGFVKKLDVWVPHELKEIHLTNRMSICDQFIKREENDPFLKRMITGDKKWIIYNNVSWKRRVGEVKHRKGKQRRRSTKRR